MRPMPFDTSLRARCLSALVKLCEAGGGDELRLRLGNEGAVEAAVANLTR